MDTQLRRKIIEFLMPLPCMRNEDNRHAILLTAGLDKLIIYNDMVGSPSNVVPLLVNALEQYGTVDNRLAIVVFLYSVATTLGCDKQKILRSWCEEIENSNSIDMEDANSEQDYFKQVSDKFYSSSNAPIQQKVEFSVPPKIQLRSQPMKVAPSDAQQNFNVGKNWPVWLNGYKPSTYIQNNYKDLGPVVSDHATGLIWQKGRSNKDLTYTQAQDYVKSLNRDKFASYDVWRLPTIPELVSLVERKKQFRLYINLIFQVKESQRDAHYWSADTGISKDAWVIRFEYRDVYKYYTTTPCYVRCVCSI